MLYQHIDPPIEFEKLTATYTSDGRMYATPDGNLYPSVTTVLSLGTDQSWKAKWIASIGQEKADQISRQATTRGTAVHKLIEDLIDNKPDWTSGHMPPNIASAKQVQPILEAHLGLVYASEAPLYSNLLRTAGRVDLIAKWDDVVSVIDFKTSKRQKEHKYVINYFMQESAYAMMFFERTGILVPQIVTVIACDEGPPQVFVERARNWIPEFIKIRNGVNI